MKDVPDDLNTRSFRRADLVLEACEIVPSGFNLDKVPADAVAGGARPEAHHSLVVGLGELVMQCRGDHIEPLARAVTVRGALEATH